jgi:electron transfer flavoprotein beta subunit
MCDAPVIVACLKLVELRASVDPLSGSVIPDPKSAGIGPADEAALEWALRMAGAWDGSVAVTSAGGEACEHVLRMAVAAGANRALRIDVDPAASSEFVAGALAGAVRELAGNQPFVVCCGDASVDRGSASVPGFLAAYLEAAQALGLVGVSVIAGAAAASLEVHRRLDRGRREHLRLEAPCVISVEGGTARLRRASLPHALAEREVVVEVLKASPLLDDHAVDLVGIEPFRPRARVVPAPAGNSARARILQLSGSFHERPRARTLVLDPDSAAEELLGALASWGELPPGLAGPQDAAQDDRRAGPDRRASRADRRSGLEGRGPGLEDLRSGRADRRSGRGDRRTAGGYR